MRRSRSYRRAQRQRVIANRTREARTINNHLYCPSGHFAKRKTFDCGVAQCMTCHSEKVLGVEREKYRLPDMDNEY